MAYGNPISTNGEPYGRKILGHANDYDYDYLNSFRIHNHESRP